VDNGMHGGDIGMSMEDLRLTAMGWKFADMLREGRLTSAEQAAGWVERNVGGSAACGTAAPAPATAATVAAAPENK